MTTQPLPYGLRSHPGLVRAAHLVFELLIVSAFYGAYELSRAAIPVRPDLALHNAAGVIHLERLLHVEIEPSVNSLVRDHSWLAIGSGYYYATLNFLVTPIVLLWVYVQRPASYLAARRMLVIASSAALLAYVLYPVAPPRLALPHLTDVTVAHDILGAAHAERSGGFVNIYAAMPSLHVGWALWCAWWVWRSFPLTAWRWAAWLYPAVTTFVVLGTANHYLLDVVGGTAVMAIGGALATVLTTTGRERPGTGTVLGTDSNHLGHRRPRRTAP